METESNYMIVCFFILRNKGSKTFSNLGSCHLELRNKSWKSECVGSFNMDLWILVFYPSQNRGIKFTNICQSMLKLKTHSGFHDLIRF